MRISEPQKGFTIVETLVAVTILMIAIAGPLSIAAKALTTALASRDQLIASYLAQESMEVVKNIRDNNLALNNSWLSASPVLSSCTAANPCDASAVDSSPIVSGKASPLKLTSNYYSHGGSGTATQFTRYFYLTPISSDEYIVTAVVEWKEGSVPYSVTMSSSIVNNLR